MEEQGAVLNKIGFLAFWVIFDDCLGPHYVRPSTVGVMLYIYSFSGLPVAAHPRLCGSTRLQVQPCCFK